MDQVAIIDRGLSDQIRQRVLKMCDAAHTWMGKQQCVREGEEDGVQFSLQTGQMALPAPRPSPLTRQVLAELDASAYWVCDKSRGCRTMLYAEHGQVYFIDSRFFVFRVAQVPPEVAANTFLAGPTLLDGDLVDTAYTVFDVVELNGTPMRHLPLHDRLVAIGSIVIVHYREVLRPHLFFGMVGKRLHKAGRARDILRHVRRAGFGHEYDDGIRRNPTAGLVFIPALHEFRPDTRQYGGTKLLKWNFPGQQTVDFRVCEPFLASGVKLHCATCNYESDVVCATAPVTPAQLQRLASEQDGELIVRCFWNRTWHLGEIRKDRSRPDTVATFIESMEAMLEAITEAELLAALGGAAAGPAAAASSDSAGRS